MKIQKELKLNTQNIKPRVEREIQPFLHRLKKKNYVEGIVLLGGLARRNFLDEYSDVDIALFYKTNTPKKYFLPFEFHINLNGKRYEFNIHQLIYEDGTTKEWDEGTKEAYLQCKVYFERDKKISKLIRLKTKFDSEGAYKRLIWIMEQYVWRGEIHSIRTCRRGYPEGSHDLLNECIDLLIEAIYILNKRFRPHKKWRIAMLTTMDVLPNNFFQDLRDAMYIKGFALKDVNKRIEALNKVYFEILKIVFQLYPDFPKDPYIYYYKNFFQPNRDTFSQKIKAKYSGLLSKDELEQLEGCQVPNF